MNKERRKAIKALIRRLEALHGEAEEIIAGVEGLTTEEEDYRDNMPESLQNGDKWQVSYDACEALDEAVSELNCLPDSVVAVIGFLTNAVGRES